MPKKVLGIAGVAVFVAVIAAVSFWILAGHSGGRSSSGQIAQDLSSAYERVLASGFSEDAMVALCDDCIDMMPPEVVDVALAEAGITDRSDASQVIGDYVRMGSVSGLSSYMSGLDIGVSFTVGEMLAEDEVRAINESLQNAGIDLEVTAGYKLGCDVELTALDGLAGLSPGETQSEHIDDAGLSAIEIGGKWYLWGSGML